jgi:molybdenum cofactor synthesis domain-containing protein
MIDHQKNISAAFIVIGDEILSGRTKDKNIGVLADFLTAHAIELQEVRIIADDEAMIVKTINELHQRCTYVCTSCGIGPTHDDITAASISKAFDLPCIEDPRAFKILEKHYAAKELEFTVARRRMTRMPEGAELIQNSISKAPGFIIKNVYVMAGVPQIFNAMLETLTDKLETGIPIYSETIDSPHPEGEIGTLLGEIQERHPNVSIGSYPCYENNQFKNQIVIRSKEKSSIHKAIDEIKDRLQILDTPH